MNVLFAFQKFPGTGGQSSTKSLLDTSYYLLVQYSNYYLSNFIDRENLEDMKATKISGARSFVKVEYLKIMYPSFS